MKTFATDCRHCLRFDAAAVALLFLTACASQAIRVDASADSWSVPGFPDLKLAIVFKDAEGDQYGPQLTAIRVAGGSVVYEGPRLYDTDFIVPTFFRFQDRTLMLADYGSEDTYGILVWSFENGTIRDLGILNVALPEETSGFTRNASPTARVELRDGIYTISIPGPLLYDPRGKNESLIARRGEVAVFTLPARR